MQRPERWRDRETLWNEVEADREAASDAQLAREVEFSIPREMEPCGRDRDWRADFVSNESSWTAGWWRT